MTVEELLKPRYKVIEKDTTNNWRVGDIIEEGDVEGPVVYSKPMINGNGGKSMWDMRLFPNYPHLFRLMHWSEERKPEDMPKYVKYIGNGRISDMAKGMVEYGLMVLEDYLPATESEYLEYINSQTPQH